MITGNCLIFPSAINPLISSSDTFVDFDNSFALACSALVVAISLTSFSLSIATKLEPVVGTSFKPKTVPVSLRPNSFTISPISFVIAFTLPNVVSQTILSPTLKVPFWTIIFATGPLPFSNEDSITVAFAFAVGSAFRSRSSDCIKIFSSKSSTPSPVLADTPINSISPPQSIGVRFFSAIWAFTISGFAVSLSILFIATIIGQPLAFAWEITSSVWAFTPSSAATTIIIISVTFAPLVLIALNASWPGVSTKVIFCPFFVIVYEFICCVIPPASPLATFELLILSNKDVLPWSTCPMIVTTGGLVTNDLVSISSS